MINDLIHDLTSIERHIGETGWAVMKVAPDQNDTSVEWFAYTVGLSKSFDWPEIICLGMPFDVVGTFVNCAVEEAQRKGLTIRAGLELTQVMRGHKTRLVPFQEEFFDEYLGFAVSYSLKHQIPLRCVQMWWPDRSGKFPDEPGCDTEVKRIQSAILKPH